MSSPKKIGVGGVGTGVSTKRMGQPHDYCQP